MIVKLIRHITITIILAVISALILFQYAESTGIIVHWNLFLAGITIGLSIFFTPELSTFQKQVIVIPGVFLFYFLIHYMIYIEFYTSPPSSVLEKAPFSRGFAYVSNLNYNGISDFWPVFTSKVKVMHLLTLIAGLEGLVYSRYRLSYHESDQHLENELPSGKSNGAIIPNKRRVKGKRFKRRF